MNCVTIKLKNACSKPSKEIIIFTIKNIEYKKKNFTVLKILHCRQKGLTRALMPDSP